LEPFLSASACLDSHRATESQRVSHNWTVWYDGHRMVGGATALLFELTSRSGSRAADSSSPPREAAKCWRILSVTLRLCVKSIPVDRMGRVQKKKNPAKPRALPCDPRVEKRFQSGGVKSGSRSGDLRPGL